MMKELVNQQGLLQKNNYREFSEIPSESIIRAEVLASVEKSTDLEQLVVRFQEYEQEVDKSKVLGLIVEAIENAERSLIWKGTSDGENVAVGYYDSFATYATCLMHEVGHYVLFKLGRSYATYNTNTDWEENFCWRFSRRACEVLSLPYSEQVARLASKFYEARKRLRDPNDDQAQVFYERLIQEEIGLTGFSESASNMELYWDASGRPQIEIFGERDR